MSFAHGVILALIACVAVCMCTIQALAHRLIAIKADADRAMAALDELRATLGLPPRRPPNEVRRTP